MSSPSTRCTILARLVTSSFRSTLLRLHHLAAAKCQQLARQARRALGGFDDVLRRVCRAAGSSSSSSSVSAKPWMIGQDVVEVVGDAAGELADGFHFLRVPQLRLELALSGNVAADAEHQVILPSRSRSGAACVRSQRRTPVRPMTSNSVGAFAGHHALMQGAELIAGIPARSSPAAAVLDLVQRRCRQHGDARRIHFDQVRRLARRS